MLTAGKAVQVVPGTVLALVEEDSLVKIEAQRRDLGKVDLGPLLCAHEQLLFIITDEARANGARGRRCRCYERPRAKA